MGEGGNRADRELVRALSHPIRVGIMETLQGRVASPTELSREMDESLGVIAYHAKTLVRCGCLELVRSEPRRGAVENFFGVSADSFAGHEDWPTASLRTRSGIAWMPLTVDEAGWREITEIMQRASRQVTEVQARSAERLAGRDGTSIIVGLTAFEAGRQQAPDDEKD